MFCTRTLTDRRLALARTSRLFLVLLFAMPLSASAQVLVSSAALPNDPGYALQQAADAASSSDGWIEGTVTDAQGDLVPGAVLTLEQKGHGHLRTATTDPAGHYLFPDVAAGTYTLLVSAHNLKTTLTPPIVELPGQHNDQPPIALAVAASASVNVSADSEQVAEQELDLQTKQRVLGVFPNFFTSFAYDAAPLNARQKFKLTVHSLFDPIEFVTTAAAAGAEQYEDTFPSWGNSDAASYGKRYAADYGDELLTRGFGYAVYPSLFHQDPRYFYMGPTFTTRKRLWHALFFGILTRGDNGNTQFNYSYLLGAATAGAISSVYHPASDGPGKLAGLNVGVGIAGKAVQGLAREFILPYFTTHVPAYATSNTPPTAAKP